MATSNVAARQPVELTKLQQQRPHELDQTESYVWHRKTVLGKGSFGKVYRGWDKRTYEEVAVKLIRREHYANDAKVRENIQREIEIQGKLKDCVNVLRLYHQEKVRDGCLLVTELCDMDLQAYIKQHNGLTEAAVRDFLQQISMGLKTMFERGIAHRDLKPGNILLKIDPVTGRRVVKLADFGFARTYLSEDEKTKMIMTSLAGTPVFMAPEALECVFHAGKSYTENVDLWSVGALLFNCLVGKPGFYATLNNILPILKSKGAAIAFETVGGRVHYIYELPAIVNSRLTKSFKAKMEELLRRLLVVDSSKRMNHHEFFAFVAQLSVPKFTVFHVGPGKKCEVNAEEYASCRDLAGRITNEFNIARDRIVGMIEGSQEMLDLTSSESLPASLTKKEPPSILYVVDESLLESSQEPTFNSIALQRLRAVTGNQAERAKLSWNSGFIPLCEKVLQELTVWLGLQNKGLNCYRRLLERDCNEVGTAKLRLQEITGQYEVCMAMVLKSWENDVELLTNLNGLQHVNKADIEDCLKQLNELKTEHISELKQLISKCQDTIKNSSEELQVAIEVNFRATVAELKQLVDRLQSETGDSAIARAITFAKNGEKCFASEVHALHSKMRNLYMQRRGSMFILTECEIVEEKRIKKADKRLSALQHSFRLAVYPSLVQGAGNANSNVDALLQKSQELEDTKKRIEEAENLNSRMLSKVDKRDRQYQEKETECQELKGQIQELQERQQQLQERLQKLEDECTALQDVVSKTAAADSLATVDWCKIEPGDAGGESLDALVVLSTGNLDQTKSPVDEQDVKKMEESVGFAAGSLEGQPSVIPRQLADGGASVTSLVSQSFSGLNVPLGDLKLACQCLAVATNFYRNSARTLRAKGVDPLTRHLSSASVSSAVSDISDMETSRSGELARSPDMPYRPWPMPEDEPLLSMFDVSFSEGTDFGTELRKLTDIVQSFNVSSLYEAIKATDSKLSVIDFAVNDLALFWPTSDPMVFKIVTTSDRKIFLAQASSRKLSSRDKGVTLMCRLIKVPVAHIAKDGNKYKLAGGTYYHTVVADVVARIS
ncbi:serine/threonine-protein kinase TBK1-like isoform X2 [Corticium candelabrum]|uniref:serine/threonine-protein kinase TBK1-like isoform X2 n=1 Tax=Corticium candelabrum TaxID=121492 RepID=UPI002E26FF4E|nr:serine/threonine-protein kinase TBK1-like isoform X2 [Corticium candelabrum]